MQNIIRYGDDGPQQPEKDGWKPSYGMLTVSRSGENIVVISGNYISQDQAQKISERMLDLQGRSQEELRQLYKEKLRQPAEETSKGASLGLIEIARRSKTPPEFEINEMMARRFSSSRLRHKEDCIPCRNNAGKNITHPAGCYRSGRGAVQA